MKILACMSLCLFIATAYGSSASEPSAGSAVRISAIDGEVVEGIGFGVVLGSPSYTHSVVVTAGHNIALIYDDLNLDTAAIEFFSDGVSECDIVSPNPNCVLVSREDWFVSDRYDIAAIELKNPNYHWPIRTPPKIERGDEVWYVGRSGRWYIPTTPGKVNSFDDRTGIFLIDGVDIFPGSSGAPVFLAHDALVGIILKDLSNGAEVLSILKISEELIRAGFSLSPETLDHLRHVEAREIALEEIEKRRLNCDADEHYCAMDLIDVRIFDVTGDNQDDLIIWFSEEGIYRGNNATTFLKFRAGQSFRNYIRKDNIDELSVGGSCPAGYVTDIRPAAGVGTFLLEGSYSQPCNNDGGDFIRIYSICANQNDRIRFIVKSEWDPSIETPDDAIHPISRAFGTVLSNVTLSRELVQLSESALLGDLRLESVTHAPEVVSVLNDDFGSNSLAVGDLVIGVGSNYLNKSSFFCELNTMSENLSPDQDLNVLVLRGKVPGERKLIVLRIRT